MADYVEGYRTYLNEERHASANTLSSYLRDIRQFAQYLSMTEAGDLSQVQQGQIQAYVNWMTARGKSASTVTRSLAALKSFYHYLTEKGVVAKTPVQNVSAAKAERHLPQILTSQEVELFLEQPQCTDMKGYRDHAMLELLYATGMRVTELITLKTEDLNQRLSYVICRDGERERVIPYGPKAREALEIYLGSARKELLKEGDSVYLFVNCSGRLMSRQGFWKLIKQYAAKAGIETDITPHTIRHSFAAHLVQNGADLKAVQEMMGHADITTTQTYLNLSVDHVKRVYAKAHPRG